MRRGATAASLIPATGKVCAAASDQAEFLTRTKIRLELPPGARGTNCKTSCSSGDRSHCLHQPVCIARPVVAASIFLGLAWPPAVLAAATADALSLTGVAALKTRPADAAALRLRRAAGAAAAAAVAAAVGSPITTAAAAAAPPPSPPPPPRRRVWPAEVRLRRFWPPEASWTRQSAQRLTRRATAAPTPRSTRAHDGKRRL